MDLYYNGRGFALSADFSRMTQDDTHGFTLSSVIYVFPERAGGHSGVSNKWLLAAGPGCLLRNPREEKFRIFVHPFAGLAILRREHDYICPVLNRRVVSGESNWLLFLSVATGLQCSMKSGLDIVLRVRPVWLADFLGFAAGVEVSGGVNFYF